ncbi:DUF4345 domain-containing protein [Phenylobacterium montanum]|uniref:DUF4345 domain-containing protein n=1 Tax=Phenylobacterium montanum TaxID=2823693 RepID=A0A975FY15_9CAUL|nr:DUF4345 domain-containing protein [Caulobacter sp. S6]QUD87069.1 DUF4345 domain-containing protein [Caulobacter sp. S6]
MAGVRILSGLLMALGVAAVAIGLSIVLLGPTPTAHSAETLFGLISRAPPLLTEPFTPTADSELRFYAPFWVVYGGFAVMTARDLRRERHRVPLLAAVFFAGGVGRAIAWWRVGPPHPVFLSLMIIELALPPVLMLLWLRRR